VGLREDLITRKWSQGCLIQAQENSKLQPHLRVTLPNNSRLIIVSQICDLLHVSLEAEPFAEVLVTIPLEGGPNGNFVNCRSPRKLHIPITTGVDTTYLEARRVDVYSVPREILLELSPDHNMKLETKVVTVLSRWLALRYSRAALPDNFEARLRDRSDEIRKTLKNVPNDIHAIYIALNSHTELPGDQAYRIAIYATMEVDNFQNTERKGRAAIALEKLVSVLSKCAGVEVYDYELTSEADLTLDDVKDLVLWNYDYLSFGASPPADVPHNLGTI